MINGYDQQQIDKWRASLYDYEKQKRTKKPFGKDPNIYEKKIVHSAQIKQKERQFDPIIQKYTQQKLQQQAEYQQQRKNSLMQATHMKTAQPKVNYDIVNLHPYNQSSELNEQNHEQWSKKKNVNNPIRNMYNIINGQSLPSGYYRTRKVKLQNDSTSRKIYTDKLQNSQFDIVKAQYRNDHEERQLAEKRRQEHKIRQKMDKYHKYDNILQRYYNPEQQWQYQQQLYQSQLTHGQDFNQHLPPSYRSREPFVPNFTEELVEKSPALKKIIEKQEKKLRSHQLRYVIEDEYKRRNEEDFERQERMINNRVHEGKILETMAKEYDIINNKLMEMNRSMMYDKKLSSSPYSYDFLKHQKSRENSNQHNRSFSINEKSRYMGNGQEGRMNWQRDNQRDNWDTRSNIYSEKSRSSANSQNRRYSIKSGGFN